MHWRMLQEDREGKVLAVILQPGDLVVETLVAVAAKHGLQFAQLSGIGAVSDATFGIARPETGDFHRHTVSEQLEVLSLTGNIAQFEDGTPAVHAHVALARSDGSALGGHLFEATVQPILEIVVTAYPELWRRVRTPGAPIAMLEPSSAGSA